MMGDWRKKPQNKQNINPVGFPPIPLLCSMPAAARSRQCNWISAWVGVLSGSAMSSAYSASIFNSIPLLSLILASNKATTRQRGPLKTPEGLRENCQYCFTLDARNSIFVKLCSTQQYLAIQKEKKIQLTLNLNASR